MELSCGPPATTARLCTDDTPVASKVPPKAALRADHVSLQDGRSDSSRRVMCVLRSRRARRTAALPRFRPRRPSAFVGVRPHPVQIFLVGVWTSAAR
jgi:hypothetical protein